MHQDPRSRPQEIHRSAPVTRRHAIASATAALLLGSAYRAVEAQQSATPEDGAAAYPEARMPDWRFSVVAIQDPYQGTITRPETTPAGLRILAAQIILTNQSEQPMEFLVSDIRLRDIDGVEYRAGEYIGEEPRIVSQNLPDGERTRGWVWFPLPEEAEPSTIIFVPPAPVMRVPLD
jgi:hypothetical protein